MKKTISIVINARLSSTRVPNKLLRPFANSSLFEIALNKYSKASFVKNIYVGIGDEKLISIAEKFPKIKILKRDLDAIKKGTHPQNITFRHYGLVDSEYILVVNPCQPLLSINTLKMAVNHFMNSDAKSYTAAIKTGDWIFNSNGEALTIVDKKNVTTNKDTSFFKGCHSFHIINKSLFMKNGYHWEFKIDDPALILVPEEETFDVDSEIDFKYTEYQYKTKHNLW